MIYINLPCSYKKSYAWAPLYFCQFFQLLCNLFSTMSSRIICMILTFPKGIVPPFKSEDILAPFTALAALYSIKYAPVFALKNPTKIFMCAGLDLSKTPTVPV